MGEERCVRIFFIFLKGGWGEVSSYAAGWIWLNLERSEQGNNKEEKTIERDKHKKYNRRENKWPNRISHRSQDRISPVS